MKCQICGLITDPDNDLCGRCFADLREQKIKLGFSVKDLNSSYQDLLAQRVRIVDAKDSSGLSLLKQKFLSLFSRSQNSEAGFSHHESAKFENDISVLDSGQQSDLKPEIKQNPQAHNGNAEPERQRGPQKLKLGKRQKQLMLDLLKDQQSTADPQQQGSRLVETGQSELDDATAPKRINEPLMVALTPEQTKLWDRSFKELGSMSGGSIQKSEIKISSLLERSSSTLSVYFDLAFEELSCPDKKRDFIRQLSERKVDSIQSHELHEAIGRYHEDSARLVPQSGSLEAGGYCLLDDKLAPRVHIRIASYLVDFALSAVFSLFLGCLLFFCKSELAPEILLGVTALQLSDLLSMALLAVPFFYLTFLLILPILRLFCGRTAGEAIMHLKLFSINSSPLSLKRSISWNLLLVFSLVSVGLFEGSRAQELWREKILNAKLLRT